MSKDELVKIVDSMEKLNTRDVLIQLIELADDSPNREHFETVADCIRELKEIYDELTA